MSADIRIAVVGTGYIAQTMIAAIGDVAGLSVVAVCSRDAQRGQDIAAASGVAAVSLEQALADPAIDAVYVANETAAHARTTIAALEAGKAVLCEKPFAVNSAEAQDIVATARRTGRLLMEAVATPFLPAVRAALDEAGAGNLGTLRHFAADFGYPTSAVSHPGCYAAQGGGVLLDRAVYAVALARLVLGPVETVRAQVTQDAGGVDVEATLLLTHAGRATSSLAASLTALLGNSMTIGGTRGSAVVDAPLLSAETVTLNAMRASTERPQPPAGLRALLSSKGAARRMLGVLRGRKAQHLSFGKSPYAHELAHFRDLYRAGALESPIMALAVSLDVMAVLDAARDQA